MWHNNPTHSAAVQDADGLSPNSGIQAEVIGMEGDLVNSSCVGGSTGQTLANAPSDLFHVAWASDHANTTWNSIFNISRDDNANLYLEWQINTVLPSQ